jgi:lipoyl(octanoyl) transferase
VRGLDTLGVPCAPARYEAPSGGILIIEEPIRYLAAWVLQSRLHDECRRNLRPGTVVILEHQPVYTLGRSAHPSHWGGNENRLRDQGAELYAVNRGGSVTYHGPGQIVVYPIVRLTHHASGPRQLVWLLEEVILRVLQGWQIDGHRLAKKPGIWILAPNPVKIASIGVRVEYGVTLHGFALNVDLDLSPFDQILPCGLSECQMTSMAAQLPTPPSIHHVKREVAHMFSEVLSAAWPTIEMRSFVDIPMVDPAHDMRAYAGA